MNDTNRAISSVAAALILVILALGLGVGLLTGTASGACPPAGADLSTTPIIAFSEPETRGQRGAWDDEQLTNARILVGVGTSLGVPPRGQLIALATALQESNLRNLRHGDRDSLGLFQQRPSQGWGTTEQILTPTYAAARFYQALVKTPGWQHLTLSRAADAVQRSANADTYGEHEAEARQLLALVAKPNLATAAGVEQLSDDPECLSGGGDGLLDASGSALPHGFMLPIDTSPQVRMAIAWALAQLGTPYSYGGDCTDPHSGNPAHQCDCSSLIQQAYAYAGVRLPRTTRDQVHVGRAVPSLAQIQPGDLVFIPGANGTHARPGHVGLYIGHDLIIQAPHTGAKIKLTSVSLWSATVAALRRWSVGDRVADRDVPHS